MADIKKFIPFVLKAEGGYSNHPNDKGGPTKYGITLEIWKQFGYDKNKDGKINAEDVKLITEEDATKIIKIKYWDRWKADEIKSQRIANTVVDWMYNSGSYGIIIPQRLLGITADGIVGPKTLLAINLVNEKEFLEKLCNERYEFYNKIIRNNPSQKVFKRGWYNRIDNLILYNNNLK